MTAAPETLAKEFATLLELMVTPAEWRQVLSTNVGADDLVCASHDVCDANMVMLQAFENVIGREPVMSWETLPNGQPDGATEAAKAALAETDNALWNAAWAIAKRDYLTAKES